LYGTPAQVSAGPTGCRPEAGHLWWQARTRVAAIEVERVVDRGRPRVSESTRPDRLGGAGSSGGRWRTVALRTARRTVHAHHRSGPRRPHHGPRLPRWRDDFEAEPAYEINHADPAGRTPRGRWSRVL